MIIGEKFFFYPSLPAFRFICLNLPTPEIEKKIVQIWKI